MKNSSVCGEAVFACFALLAARVLPGMAFVLSFLALPVARVEGGDQLQVPLRWVALKGSPAVTNPGGVGEANTNDVLWRRHERASDRIWIPGANITFRSAITREILDIDQASFPVIDDPRPPGTGPGAEGDILNPDIDDSELKEALASALAAWDALEKDINQKRAARGLPAVNIEGPVVINLRKFVDQNGTPGFLGGKAYSYYSGATSSDICKNAPTGNPSLDGAATYAAVEDVSFRLSFEPDDELLAHELGHCLLLEHGNGLDDDMDGAFDGYGAGQKGCDPTEDVNATPFSLMATSTNQGTSVITALQRTRARLGAAGVPGAKLDPPAVLIDADTVGDHRADPVGDVADAAVDIISAGVIVNNVSQTTVLSHQLFGSIPAPPFQFKRYLMFLDLDGNQATGGAPATLGFPTGFQGAELVTRVTISHSGEIPSVSITPTVWKFQSNAFVEVTDPSIVVHVTSVNDAESNAPSFDVVSIEMSNSVRGDMGTQLRLQAIAQQTTGMVLLDQLPDGPADMSDPLVMVPPQYPVCGVTPAQVRPGGAITVEANGLLPGQTAKVFIGDDFVGMGPIDATGSARIAVGVPTDSSQGDRLVTMGVMGLALTADCSVEVRGTPLNPPSIVCPQAVTEECGSTSGNSIPLVASVADADGDPLTVTWEVDDVLVQTNDVPAGGPPTSAMVSFNSVYGVGSHTVRITVSDGTTLPVSCTTTVNIVDTIPPAVSCSVAISRFWPPSHGLVNVGLTANASDTCDPQLAITVEVFGDENDETPTGDGNYSPDARDLAVGRLRLRAERSQNGDGRVYLIVVTATDASGNQAVSCCTVVTPKDQGKRSIDSVNSQAAAARAFCASHGGAPPADYFVVGDGSTLGSKQ
jgi:hypothetical protein